MKLKKDQYLWVHYVKAVAIVMVVILHVAAPYLYQLGKISIEEWDVANIYDSFVRPCVPLFFMSSGFLLLRKSEPVSDFFAKRINRVLWPLAFWSVIYALWKVYFQGVDYSDFGSGGKFLISPVSYHLWYLYAIVGCYLFLPLLRSVAAGNNDFLIGYYCAIWFFAVAIYPLAERYLGIKGQIDLAYASGYIGYFALGYLLGKREYRAVHAIVALFVMLACWIMIAYMTRVLTISNKNVFVGGFYSYLSPMVIIASAAWFVLIKFLACLPALGTKENLNRLVVSISACSFGVYLIHVIFIDLFTGFLGRWIPSAASVSVINIPLLSVIVFVISYVAILLLGKISFLRRVVGV